MRRALEKRPRRRLRKNNPLLLAAEACFPLIVRLNGKETATQKACIMKALVISILVGTVLTSVGATGQPLMALTSDQRSIEVGGVAGGIDGSDSYSYSQTPSSPFGSFSTNVYGNANWSDTTPWYPGLDPGSYHAESGASQQSQINANSFICSSRIWGSDWVSLQGPYGPANPYATTTFSVSFALTSSVYYDLTIGFAAGNYTTWNEGTDRGTPQLFSTGQTDLLLTPTQEATDAGTLRHYSGLLEAGDYTLLVTQSFSLPPDPLGQSADVGYDMSFNITAVPEPSTFTLFGLGLLAVTGLRRFGRSSK